MKQFSATKSQLSRFLIAGIGFLVLILSTSSSHATTIAFGPSFAVTDGGDHVFELTTPTTATSDATLTLSIAGDFDFPGENAIITVDGFNLGTILNRDGSDDLFNFDFNGEDNVRITSSPSNVTDFNELVTSSATISLIQLLPIIADGQIVISVLTSDLVTSVFANTFPNSPVNFPDNFNAPDIASSFVQGTLEIPNDLAPVPLPAALPLLLAALGGFFFLRLQTGFSHSSRPVVFKIFQLAN